MPRSSIYALATRTDDPEVDGAGAFVLLTVGDGAEAGTMEGETIGDDPVFAGDGATPVEDGEGAEAEREGAGVDDFGGGEEAFRGGGAGVALGGGEAAAAVTVIPNAMMGQCPGTPQINQ